MTTPARESNTDGTVITNGDHDVIERTRPIEALPQCSIVGEGLVPSRKAEAKDLGSRIEQPRRESSPPYSSGWRLTRHVPGPSSQVILSLSKNSSSSVSLVPPGVRHASPATLPDGVHALPHLTSSRPPGKISAAASSSRVGIAHLSVPSGRWQVTRYVRGPHLMTSSRPPEWATH